MKLYISLSETFHMYHGSPFAELDFSTLNRGMVFLTRDRKIAESYARGRVAFTGKGDGPKKPTIYTVFAQPTKIFDLRKEPHREIYKQIRLNNPDEELPGINSEGFVMRHTGLPSFGHVGGLKTALPKAGFDAMWVDEGSQGLSLAVFNPKVIHIDKAETLH